MTLEAVFHDGQAETRALPLAPRREERHEDVGQMIRRNASAIVRHDDGDSLGTVLAIPDLRGHDDTSVTCRSGLRGIREQIHEDLDELLAHGSDRKNVAAVAALYANPGRRPHVLAEGNRLADDPMHHHR